MSYGDVHKFYQVLRTISRLFHNNKIIVNWIKMAFFWILKYQSTPI